MHYGAMLVGQFLKAAEFGTGTIPAQPTFTIANVVLEKLESVAVGDNEGSSKMKTKGVVYFREVDRGWVLNRTNAECLAAIFGKETNDWIGKRVTLFAADVRVGAKMDIGIRVKGSPDIAKEVTVSVKLPRRKPIPMRLIPTGDDDEPPQAATMTLKQFQTMLDECDSVDELKSTWKTSEARLGAAVAEAKEAYKGRLAQIRGES